MHRGECNAQLRLRVEAQTLHQFVGAWRGEADVPLPVFDPAVELDRQPLLVGRSRPPC